MARILVVEDEMRIARNLRDYLEVAGFEVSVVGDGGAALSSARGDEIAVERPKIALQQHRHVVVVVGDQDDRSFGH